MVKRSGVAIIMVGATLAVVFTLFAWEARRSQHSTSAHSTFPRTGAVTVSPPRSAVVFYKSPSLSTILEHTAINAEDGGRGIPDDQTVCFAYGLGKDALHEPVSWSVSDFTNLRVADRLADQAGVNGAPTGYGSTACQVRGTSMGFLVNKDTSPRVASYYGLSLAYSFGSGAAYRPWSSAYPPDAELRLETYYANGRRQTQTAVQYGQVFVGLRDTVTRQSFWYVLTTWDSSGVPSEDVHNDSELGGGTSNYVIDSHFGRETQYSTLADASQTTAGNGVCGCQRYSAYITKQNLTRALTRINAKYHLHLSTDPSNYLLTFVGSGTEQHSPPGTDGWIASRIWDVLVRTEF